MSLSSGDTAPVCLGFRPHLPNCILQANTFRNEKILYFFPCLLLLNFLCILGNRFREAKKQL